MELEELVHRVGHAEGVRLTAHVTDTYVATAISKFDKAEIPDMSKPHRESLHCISNTSLTPYCAVLSPHPNASTDSTFSRAQ
jgi:hypothetical protein